MSDAQIAAGLLIAVFTLFVAFVVSLQGWVDTLKQAGVVGLIVAVSMLVAKLFF